MPIPAWVPAVDNVTDVLAKHPNDIYDELTKGLPLAMYSSTVTLTGTKTLTDADFIMQFLDPGGAGRNVLLPPEANTNHTFWIVNKADAAETLTVKDDSAATTIGTVAQGETKMFTSNGLAWVMLTVGLGTVREILTTTRTYYVRTDGNDSNTGLVNNAGGAFLTIQKALTVASTLIDAKNYNVVIQIADGTYVSGPLVCSNILGTGTVYIQGNSGTPANVVIDGGFLKNTPGTPYYIRDMALLKSSGTATKALDVENGAQVQFATLIFGAGFTQHLYAYNGGQIEAMGNYTITGGAGYHWFLSSGARISTNSRTITLTGTPAFTTAFVVSYFLSQVSCYGMTFTGGATGVRYGVTQNSAIFTNGGGATYLPGDAAGSAATGGLYL